MKIALNHTNSLDDVVKYLELTDKSAYVFANSSSLTFRSAKNLEAKLDKAKSEIDVIHIYGKVKNKFNMVNMYVPG